MTTIKMPPVNIGKSMSTGPLPEEGSRWINKGTPCLPEFVVKCLINRCYLDEKKLKLGVMNHYIIYSNSNGSVHCTSLEYWRENFELYDERVTKSLERSNKDYFDNYEDAP